MCSKYNSNDNLHGSQITLISMEGDKFNITKEACSSSGLLKNMTNLNSSQCDDCDGSDSEEEDNENVNLDNISSFCLKEAISFMEYYCKNPMPKIQAPLPPKEVFLENLGNDFYRDLTKKNTDYICSMIKTSNYMDIQPLLNLMCASFANIIKGKTPEEIKDYFGFDDDDSIPKKIMRK